MPLISTTSAALSFFSLPERRTKRLELASTSIELLCVGIFERISVPDDRSHSESYVDMARVLPAYCKVSIRTHGRQKV